jgi:hypothetical protein
MLPQKVASLALARSLRVFFILPHLLSMFVKIRMLLDEVNFA